MLIDRHTCWEGLPSQDLFMRICAGFSFCPISVALPVIAAQSWCFHSDTCSTVSVLPFMRWTWMVCSWLLMCDCDGAVNRRFLRHLFLDFNIAIQFLKDTGLIRSQMTCETCGLDMTWSAIPQCRDRFWWRCRRRAATVCSETQSIKYGSWFHHSCLTFQEVLFLTYEIVHNVPAKRILHEYGHGSATVTDWRQFVREAMAVYLQDNSQKIGGPDKTVDIDDSKFGKRKYHRGHRVQG